VGTDEEYGSIRLEQREYGFMFVIPHKMESVLSGDVVRRVELQATEFALCRKLPSRVIEKVDVRVPASWWDATKARFRLVRVLFGAPRYVEHTLERLHSFPDWYPPEMGEPIELLEHNVDVVRGVGTP
jgi:hypothetical protein